MPQTPQKGSDLLEICLEADRQIYAPGDTIVGRVTRKAPLVTIHAVLTVSFHGRTKSKLVRSNGNTSTTYRGRVNLVDGRDPEMFQQIFTGPVHIPAGGDEESWPFSINIPSRVDPTCILTQVSQETSYLPVSAEDVATQRLPSTFSLETFGSTEAFVEYYIKAELRPMGSLSSTHLFEATRPVTIYASSPDPPIVDFGLKPEEGVATVWKYRLVPGMENAELSFAQKFKQSFGSGSVPKFVFTWRVLVPSVVQLDNPTPIPFKMQIVPLWDRCSEVLRGIHPTVELTRLVMSIEAITEVKCEGTFSPHHKSKEKEIEVVLDSAVSRLETPICIPCTDECPPLDVGERLDIRVGRVGPIHSASERQPWSRDQFFPSFVTYNIHHTHKLKWEAKLTIAEDDLRLRGEQMIQLLEESEGTSPVDDNSLRQDAKGKGVSTRSESWIREPAEEEAPPSFAQVQKEDGKSRVHVSLDTKS